MQVLSDDRALFEDAVGELKKENRVKVGKDDLLRLPPVGDEVVGVFRQNPRGFGFVVPDDSYAEGDLFIPPGKCGDAISGDRVRVSVMRESGRRQRRGGKTDVTGRIVEVLERGRTTFVGTLIKQKGQWLVEPDGRILLEPVIIRDPQAKNAKAGDKVAIELLHYPERDYYAEGVITQVMGEAGRPDVETQAVIVAHGLRTEFPAEALQEAKKATGEFQETGEEIGEDREDLRDQFIFTIDPPDAKDFDDAISISWNEQTQEWTLGVHIADVSHFVKPGSILDEEAQARGNSVYLPRLVIPMLPELLSNGVCSLQEGVLRYTKSVFITFNARGQVKDQRLASTVIDSKKRLTYLEAQAIIDGNMKEARKHAKTSANYSDELVEKLGQCDRLAKTLRKRRMKDGMIVLNLPEVDLVFDDEGHVVDAVPEDDAFTHTIIEMFMVEANEALARSFNELLVPVLRRIHPEPSFGDMETLRMFAVAAKVGLPEKPTRKDIQHLLEATKDTPAARAIHFAVLRTLTKAEYSPAAIGHFALGSDHYAHYTSPIRRYPDLMLHRVMQAYLDLTENGKKIPGGKKRHGLGGRVMEDPRVLDEGMLIEMGRQCSDREVEATAAERELRDFLVMQFLQEHHLGEVFKGVVTGTTGKGVFVSINRFLVEGLVKTEDISTHSSDKKENANRERELRGRSGKHSGGGGWERNDQTGRLTARRGRSSIGLGDVVEVRIDRIDLAARQMELAMTGRG